MFYNNSIDKLFYVLFGYHNLPLPPPQQKTQGYKHTHRHRKIVIQLEKYSTECFWIYCWSKFQFLKNRGPGKTCVFIYVFSHMKFSWLYFPFHLKRWSTRKHEEMLVSDSCILRVEFENYTWQRDIFLLGDLWSDLTLISIPLTQRRIYTLSEPVNKHWLCYM